MYLRTSLFAALFVLTAPALHADLITGQVVDSMGTPVPGVDLDARDLISGDDVNLINDGTDANGMFTTTIPAGLYRITFTPPSPPTTTHLMERLDDIVVVGTTNLGVVSLPAGVSVGGTTIDLGGLPVENVNIDVIELSSGDDLDLVGDTTDSSGQFLIAVPATQIELQLRTNNLATTLAPQAFELDLSGNASIGTVTLLPGFHVTGTVLNASANPLQGADTDMRNVATGEKAFTPNDNSNSSGQFSVVVPGGTWDLEICPPNGALLVGEESTDLVIASDVSTGVFQLQAGVLLTGQVQDSMGMPVQGADVDVDDAGTGVSIVLCGDNTDASGNYSVIVPNGTFDLNFEAPGGIDFQNDVVISGNTVVNSTLTACVSGSAAFRNAGTNPASMSTTSPSVGNGLTVSVDLTTTGHSLAIIMGFETALTLPLGGGQVLLTNIADPGGELLFQSLVPGPTAVFQLQVPPDEIFCGLTISMQAIHVGGVAPFALSNAQDLVLGTTF